MPPNDLSAIQKSIARRLQSNFDAGQIKEIAGAIAKLQNSGVKIDDVFPFGIRIQPEGASIRGHISQLQLGELTEMISHFDNLHSVQVFPRGIIAPDTFRIHLNLNQGMRKELK